MSKLDEIQKICLNRGIVFPTAEIYPTISGFWDYGPIGTLLKRKFIEYWRKTFIKSLDNVFEIDGSTILSEKVLKASGHVDSFVDPITQCDKCKSLFRADHIIEEKTGNFVEGKSNEELTKIIRDAKLVCPNCKGKLSDVRVFHLMLKTEISSVGGQVGYLRPESAQNVFTSFQRVFRSTRAKLPMGVAQVGHAYRNEISPRNFLIRVREFNQMEVEMFFDPNNDKCPLFDQVKDKEIMLFTREDQQKKGKSIKIKVGDALKKKILPNEWIGFFLAKEFEFYKSLGIPESHLRFRHMLPEETPHYSGGNFDLEIDFEDIGWKETVGNAYRTDYDLIKHSKHANTDLSVALDNGTKVIPHVVEPSFGVERTITGVLLHCFVEDKERGWNWFKFPANISPYIASVFPLVNKDEIPEKSREIFEILKKDFDVLYDESGSIGKRYARADEIGIVVNITCDYDTLKDDTVTIRDRNTTKQIRVKIKDLKNILSELLEGKKLGTF
ncbi:MAG: glycine--tRNA ligase [Candidatus Aenigmarchaeota archaeon]|nr:glycine--tRNA ligase [Candidatus Aenigmarchaeota archaeon]